MGSLNNCQPTNQFQLFFNKSHQVHRSYLVFKSSQVLLRQQSSVGHLGKGLDDVGDRIVVAHVVKVEAAEADRLIEVSDDLHVLQLGDHRVLEALLEQVVVSLLDGALVLG